MTSDGAVGSLRRGRVPVWGRHVYRPVASVRQVVRLPRLQRRGRLRPYVPAAAPPTALVECLKTTESQHLYTLKDDPFVFARYVCQYFSNIIKYDAVLFW